MMMIKPVRTLYRFLQPMWDTAREREREIYRERGLGYSGVPRDFPIGVG